MFVRRRGERSRPRTAAAVAKQAALVKLAAAQCVCDLPLAEARGKHGVALVYGIIDAVNSRQGWCKRNGRSGPSRATVLSTGSTTARKLLHVWEQRTTRRIFAKRTIHIIRTHIFFLPDLLSQNPQCRFYEVPWYMTAIHPRFTPNPIFVLDQGTHPRDSGLTTLIQSDMDFIVAQTAVGLTPLKTNTQIRNIKIHTIPPTEEI